MSRKPWKDRTKIKLKVEDINPRCRINIHQDVVKPGSWSATIDNHHIEIKHTAVDQITAFINGRPLQTWQLYEKPIRGEIWRPVRDENGNRRKRTDANGNTKDIQRLQALPPDEAFQYYVISSATGKRYKYLYIHDHVIATRDGHGAGRWRRKCLSGRQRKTQQYYEFLSLTRRQQQKWIRRHGFVMLVRPS